MKTININIGESDLERLKKNQYALCMAWRERTMGYDVIGFSSMKYLESNTIHLEEGYELFCCQNISNGQKISLSVPFHAIDLGEQITLSEAGIFSSPVSGKTPDALELINDYGDIYPGFTRKINFSGNECVVPAFISPYASIKGSYTLKPDDAVILWFEQFAESGVFLNTLYAKLVCAGKSRFIEISPASAPVNLLYENEAWVKQAPPCSAFQSSN